MATIHIPKSEAASGLRVVAARHSELSKLCREFHILRLELFGSALSSAFGFKEALERLFGRPVDLVVASAIRNPYFRRGIEQSKALLYAA